MDKSVKWKSDFTNTNINNNSVSTPKSESSPTLSDGHPQPIKRKRSSIFSRLRKSIFPSPSEETSSKLDVTDILELKRTVSLDAGLQKRISQLTPNSNEANDNNSREDSIFEEKSTSDVIQRKGSLKRSKSLVPSFIEPLFADSSAMMEDIKVVGSQLQSPIEQQQRHKDSKTSNICDSFDLNLDKFNNQPQVDQQIQVSVAKVFNCTWLAPTRKFRSFPGNMYLLPSETIMFYSNSSDRVVRLQFNLSDILNISRGSWNGQRDQALIIDLTHGKRKTWVFVGWKAGEFRESVEAIVDQWMKVVNLKIKEQLQSKRSQLNQKYCRFIKKSGVIGVREDKTAVEEAVKSDYLVLVNIYEYFKGIYDKVSKSISNKNALVSDMIVKYPLSHKYGSYKNILLNRTVSYVTPQILSQILTDQATNFMDNFRAIQGVILHTDSGWHSTDRMPGLYEGESRSYSKVLTTSDSTPTLAKKWRVIQTILKSSTELVIFDLLLRPQIVDDDGESFKFKIRYEIWREVKVNNNNNNSEEVEEDLNTIFNDQDHEYDCNIKVSAEIEYDRAPQTATTTITPTITTKNTKFNSAHHHDLKVKKIEQDLCKYFRDSYFPQMFHLLPSMLEDAQFDFDSQLGIQDLQLPIPPPHYRYLKFRVKEMFRKGQLYFTVWLLPILYRSKSFKYFKFILIVIIPIVYIIYFLYHLCVKHYLNRSVESTPLETFHDFIGSLAEDLSETSNSIHSLKLKYGNSAD